MKSNTGKFTEHEIAIAERMWRDGDSAHKIAAALGRGRSSVMGIMNRNRDRFPKKGGPSSMGGGIKWTDAEIEKAAEMWAAGSSSDDIAEAIGRTRRAVEDKAMMMRERFPKRASKKASKPRTVKRSNAGTSTSRDRSLARIAERIPVPRITSEYAVSFIDSGAHQCRYPLDNDSQGEMGGPNMMVCGAIVSKPFGRALHGSYCADHRSIMVRV